MSDKQINNVTLGQIRERLCDKRDELDERIRRLKKSGQVPLSPDSKEQAVQLENYEVMDGLLAEANVELSKVLNALDRMSDGAYGICQDCNEKITFKRLEARPHAQRCMVCQEKAETVMESA